ncbi:MAG TPA: hypothetical protein PK796_06625 [Bacteroidales bacterium]|nr:hypothetical protein [Bacteroidales bacterium]
MKKLILLLVISFFSGYSYAQIMEPKVFCIDNHIFFFEHNGEKFNIEKYYASLCVKFEKRFFKSNIDPIYLSFGNPLPDSSFKYSLGWENMERSREIDVARLVNCPDCKIGIRIVLPLKKDEEENLVRILTYGLNNKSELKRLRDIMIVNNLEYSTCRLSEEKMEDVLKSSLTKKQIRFIKRFKIRFNSDKVHLSNPYDSNLLIK